MLLCSILLLACNDLGFVAGEFKFVTVHSYNTRQYLFYVVGSRLRAWGSQNQSTAGRLSRHPAGGEKAGTRGRRGGKR